MATEFILKGREGIIRKIAIIEPAHNRGQVFGLNDMELIGPILIGTVLRNAGYDVRVFREGIKGDIDWLWVYKADLVGISFMTPLATRAYEIGDELKSQGILVVMGGIHATLCAEESLEHCDFVVRHEGEDAIIELLNCIKRGGEGVDKILGISYKKDGKICHNGNRPFINDLDAYPMPDFLLVSKIKKEGILEKMLFCPMKPIFTSRGCTHNCTFCSVRLMFGGKYRVKSTARVIGEIKHMTMFGNSFFFVDDNLGVDRDRLKELCQAIIDGGLNITWNAQVRADLSQYPEVLNLMGKAGCTRVHIGFESADDASLKAMGKRQSAGTAKEAIRAFHKAGIKVHAMFILGFDSDDKRIFEKTLKFLKNIEADTGHCAPLTMFPGTRDYKKMCKNNRLIPGVPWENMDMFSVTYYPSRMTPRELQEGLFWVMKKFYGFCYLKNMLNEGMFALKVYFYAKMTLRKAKAHMKEHLKRYRL